MWSSHDDVGYYDDDDLEFRTNNYEIDSQGDSDHVDSDIETLLYTQVYHIRVEDDDCQKPAINCESNSIKSMREVHRSQKFTAKSIKVEEVPPAIKIKVPPAVKVLHAAKDSPDEKDDIDSIYASKVPCQADSTKSKKKKKLNAKLSPINYEEPANQEEVEITIRRPDRLRTCKSTLTSATSSSDSDDDDDGSPLNPSDISSIYTHLSENGSSPAEGEALLKAISDTKSVQEVKLLKQKTVPNLKDKKKRKLEKSPVRQKDVENRKTKKKKQKLESEGAGEVAFLNRKLANKQKLEDVDIKEDKPMTKDELRAACMKAMAEFYTTLNSTSDSLDLKDFYNKQRIASNWTILDSDRCGAKKQTRGRFFMTCALCKESGHLVESCPKARKAPSCRLCGEDHLMDACQNRRCSLCWQPWHPINHCPYTRYDEREPCCLICNRFGHVDEQCSDHWRKFHSWIDPDQEPAPPDRRQQQQLKSFREASCYNCGRKGHFGHECSARRMDANLIPFLPFVTNYDLRRNHQDRSGFDRHDESRYFSGTSRQSGLSYKERKRAAKFTDDFYSLGEKKHFKPWKDPDERAKKKLMKKKLRKDMKRIKRKEKMKRKKKAEKQRKTSM